MAYRTDLAVEIKNDLEEENGLEKSVQKKHGISIISIKIKTKKTAKKLQKPIGNYKHPAQSNFRAAKLRIC